MQELFKIQDIAPVIKGRRYFLEDKEIFYNPSYLGETYDKEFFPSPILIEMLSLKLPSVFLNKRSSWFFTLGRNLIQKEVTKEEKGTISAKTFIVRNGYNEILGLAQKQGSNYFNIYDIGHFLRREKE